MENRVKEKYEKEEAAERNCYMKIIIFLNHWAAEGEREKNLESRSESEPGKGGKALFQCLFLTTWICFTG